MKLLDKLEELVCSIGLLAATVILFVNIFLRYIFSSGFPWAEEAVRYLFLLITFIGLGIGIRQNQTIRVDFLLQLMKNKPRIALEIMVNVIEILFSVWLSVISFQFAMQTKIFGQVTSALQLPFFILYLIMSVGLFLTAIRYIQQFILNLKEARAIYRGETKG